MSMNSFHARQGRPRHAAESHKPVDRHGLLRVDQLLVAQGLAPSRTAARALIEASRVCHDGQPVAKPSLELPPDARLTVTPDDSDRFVSRGALKLEGALARSGLDVQGEGEQQVLRFTSNVEDQVEAGPDNPLRVVIDPVTQEPSPYVLMRSNLEALIHRNVFYQLVELAVPHVIDGEEWLGVWSRGAFYPIGRG